MSIWSDDRAVGDGDAPWALDRGLLLGDGLFETVLVVGGEAPLLDRHLARMRRSADALGLPLPDALGDRVVESVAPLWECEGRPGRAALRISVTTGTGRGLSPADAGEPGLWIALSPAAAPDADGCAPPARAVILDSPRLDPGHPLAGHKTLSAMTWVHARRSANAAGGDLGLVPTLDGDVAEADSANLFAVVGDEVVTPPLDRGILPGITRERCLEALRIDGREVAERRLDPAELAGAAEVFVTSSVDGIRPVMSLGNTRIQAPGPTARWLGACLVRLASG